MSLDEKTTGERNTLPRGARWFLLVAGNGRIAAHTLDTDPIVIGRAPECTVVIDDRAFSRRHASLRLPPSAEVQDLGSKNGILVDGVRVNGGPPVSLSKTLSFHIGSFCFVLVAASARATTSSSLTGEEALRVLDPTPEGATQFVRDVAKTALSVLIFGETGVGKDVLAAAIHQLSGRRGLFSPINCAALSETLLESELFGHERGAFTGAAATKIGLLEASDGGTVFLDEIGELPLETQAKLLRAVEAREAFRIGSTRPTKFDVRFIAATNRDLAAEVSRGRFRADLFFRLADATFLIPPLRERKHLISSLALSFLRDASLRDGREPSPVMPEVLAALEAHTWPGNIRELKALVERAQLLARGGPIQLKHLSFTKTVVSSPPEEPATAHEPARDSLTSEEREDRDTIVQTLEECAGNQTRAAKALGISRTTLVQKLKLYRIARPRKK